MPDHLLKLRLSAILLVEEDVQGASHYQLRLEQLYDTKYTIEEVTNALKEVLELKEETAINIFLTESQDDMPVYPDQFFEGN